MQANFFSLLCICLPVLCYGYGYQSTLRSAEAQSNQNKFAGDANQTRKVYLMHVKAGIQNQDTQFYMVVSTISNNVGAYYYPWYLNDFHGGYYLRKHLVPLQEPVPGEYNDRNEDVITRHLKWS